MIAKMETSLAWHIQTIYNIVWSVEIFCLLSQTSNEVLFPRYWSASSPICRTGGKSEVWFQRSFKILIKPLNFAKSFWVRKGGTVSLRSLCSLFCPKKSIKLLRKLQYLSLLNFQALLKSYKLHLKRLSAPEDHKRHEILAKNMI